LSNNRITYKIIGILIILISSYWVLKTGYHLINYENTGGLDNNVLGNPKKYSEIVLTFLFWLLQIIGGIGILIINKNGLKTGLISILTAGIFALIYSVFITSEKLNYSSKISVNGIEKEMLISEKWNFIYSEPISIISLTIILLFITFLIIKRLRILKKEAKKASVQHRI
jgi:hypothetical protein